MRSQGGRLTGQKGYLVWRQIIHLVMKGWPVISTESLPRLVFTELSSVTQTPRLQRHWKSSVSGRSEADDNTSQRSRTTALARVHRLHRLSYPLMVHIFPICIPSRQLYEKLFRGGVAISNKKKLSLIDLKVMKTRNDCEIACDCVKRANVVLHVGQCCLWTPSRVCCLGEKWRLSVGRSRGRARQNHTEAMEKGEQRLLSAKIAARRRRRS